MLQARAAARVADGALWVAAPGHTAYSQTFVRDHIARLPTRVAVLPDSYLRLDPGRLRRALLESKALAVLAEFGPTGVGLMEATAAAQVPLIVHFHGYDAYLHRVLKHNQQHYQRLFAIAAAIVVVSRDMERQLLSLGAPREKLHYNPCGVDTALFAAADPAAAPARFLSVGRMVDKKAPHLTLLAFARVAREVPNAQCVMIGDGALLESSRQLARALCVAERVSFLGACSHTAVAAQMRGARALVQHSLHTSYGDSEGTPLAVIEAGAAQLPVVATRHGGIQDVVIDGGTGFLVDEGDVEGMAARMVQLCRDPALAARLGRAARARVCAEFSIQQRIDALWYIIATAAQLR
ncbi:MAG: glycosyltransferase [Chloroflexales bacterium]|nr:glycosyltransferase [Chloroflexales bacterium]